MIEAPSFALPGTEPAPFAGPSGPLLRRTLVRVAVAPTGWREDLRFFAVAYALALLFFLLLIG